MNPRRRPSNVAASVRARLQNYARARDADFQRVLSDFAIERWLYRLGASRHSEQFVLKGAMLFRLWSDDRLRATWDLDLLGRDASDVEGVVGIVKEICAIPSNDGIVFDISSIKGERIRAAEEIAGVRVRLEAGLADARIPVQVDVGFGNAITPSPLWETYPTVLDQEAPTILAYPREAVVAEKLHAMISLGVTNSRMKDYYDLHILSASFSFEGPILAAAIHATFERRGTPFPADDPLVLTDEFLGAQERQTMWMAFLRRARLAGPPSAVELGSTLRQFLLPIIHAVAQGRDFMAVWSPGGPWENPSDLSRTVSEPLVTYGVIPRRSEAGEGMLRSLVSRRGKRSAVPRPSPPARLWSTIRAVPTRPGTP